MTHLNMNKDCNDSYSEDLKDPVQNGALDDSVVKNIDISINIDTEISERYQY